MSGGVTSGRQMRLTFRENKPDVDDSPWRRRTTGDRPLQLTGDAIDPNSCRLICVVVVVVQLIFSSLYKNYHIPLQNRAPKVSHQIGVGHLLYRAGVGSTLYLDYSGDSIRIIHYTLRYSFDYEAAIATGRSLICYRKNRPT